MQKFALISLSLLLLGALWWGLTIVYSERNREMTQRVYVWQRIQNSPEVVTAIKTIPIDEIAGLLPLVAEIHFRNGADKAPEVMRPSLALSALKERGGKGYRDAAVIRIGTSARDTGWNDSACQIIEKLARDFIEGNEWSVGELQLDYDCPQKRLSDYAKLLKYLRRSFPDQKITFTALPSWLDEPEFRELAVVADSFVLQVHSLQIPDDSTHEVNLISANAARRAVQKAAKVGRPFEVALPTYSCFVMFSADGSEVVDVISEDLPEQWPVTLGKIRLGQTDPASMASLVAGWNESRPAEMMGLIWYRLPVESDEMNWTESVWRKVIRGEVPEVQMGVLVSVAKAVDGNRYDLVLKNTGETAVRLPPVIALQISGNGTYRFDGGQVYEGKGDPLQFHLLSGKSDLLPLPAGESVFIGWIEGDVEVAASLEEAEVE